jgi:hypothetical protein
MSEPIDLGAIRARADTAVDEARTWREVISGLAESGMDIPALLAEVESLRASNGQIRGDLERLRAENAGLREREVRRHSKFSQVQPRVSVLEILGCADDGGVGSPDHPRDPADCPVCRHALGLPEPANGAGAAGQRLPSHAPTALTQVHPDADGSPVVSAFPAPLLDEWGRRHEDTRLIGPPFATPDATVTIEPDVSGFEALS